MTNLLFLILGAPLLVLGGSLWIIWHISIKEMTAVNFGWLAFFVFWAVYLIWSRYKKLRIEILQVLISDAYRKLGLSEKAAKQVKIVPDSKKVNLEPNWETNPIEIVVKKGGYILYKYHYENSRSPCFKKEYSSIEPLLKEFLLDKLETVITLKSYKDSKVIGSSKTMKPFVKIDQDFDKYFQTINESREAHRKICWDVYENYFHAPLFKLSKLVTDIVD